MPTVIKAANHILTFMSVLRIHLILMLIRIGILDPQLKKKDPNPVPDPGHFLKDLLNIFTKRLIFKFFLFFFSLIFILKPFRNEEIFMISLRFKSSDLGFRSKVYFCSFWMIFYPLDPDQDPGSQNLANPTDPDLKHCFM